MFVPVIRGRAMALNSAVHVCHRTSFALLIWGQPGVKFRWLLGMKGAFLSHSWPESGQYNGIPEDEHWAPHWGGPVSTPGSEGQLRTSLPSDTARAAAKGTWSPQPRGKGQWRSVRVSRACWCAQSLSTGVWCSAGGMNLSSWPWRRNLWEGRRNTGLEFVVSCHWTLVFWVIWSQVFGIKPVSHWGETKVLWNQTLCPCSDPPGHWCILGSTLWSASLSLPGSLMLSSQVSPVMHGFARPLATRTTSLPESWLSSSSCSDQSTEMHLEIKRKDRKRKKRKKEKDENGEGRKLSWKLASQFPSARH